MKKVFIVCGKTGGHFFPALALAKELQSSSEIYIEFLVTQGALDHSYVGQEGWNVYPVVLPKNHFYALLYFFKMFFKFRKKFKQQQFFAVIGFGGILSFVPLVAARSLGIFTMIHEPNAIWGRANDWLRYFVNCVTIGYKEVAPRIDRYIVTGIPIRSEFYQRVIPELMPKKEISVLILGGSQGAKKINEHIPILLRQLSQSFALRVIHITGPLQFHKVQAAYQGAFFSYEVLDFCSDMFDKLLQADWVICRSGASSLAEIAAMGRPSILIPYPYAVDNHQYFNALIFKKNGASVIIEEKKLEECFLEIMIDLLSTPKKALEMSQAARKLAVSDAALRMAALVLEKI